MGSTAFLLPRGSNVPLMGWPPSILNFAMRSVPEWLGD